MRSSSTKFFGTVALIAASYLLVGALSRALANAQTHTVAVWLAAGVVFGALLVAPWRQWAAVLCGAALAAAVWGTAAQRLGLAGSLLFAAAEVTSVAVGAWLARSGIERDTDQVHRAGYFVLGALATGLIGATLGAELWRWHRPGIAYGAEWRTWATSTAVGILLAAPVIAAFKDFAVKRSGGMGMAQFGAGLAAFAVFVLVGWSVFGLGVEQRFGTVASTLAYLPMPFLLLASMLWGARGGSVAMLVGALLLIGLTAAGGGPFVVAEAFVGEAVVEVQAYVAVWAMLALLLQALSEGRRGALADARAWQLRYERTLQASGVASVEFDAVTGAALWGEGAAALLGPEAADLGRIADWHARIDPGDRPIAERAWQAVVQGRQAGAIDSYSVRLGGASVPVEMSLAAVHGPDGAVEQVAGLLRVAAAKVAEERRG